MQQSNLVHFKNHMQKQFFQDPKLFCLSMFQEDYGWHFEVYCGSHWKDNAYVKELKMNETELCRGINLLNCIT